MTVSAVNSRTHRILRQAGIGLFSRFGAMASTLAATPLMLHMLGSTELGAWLVLLSIFQWITMFDLGIAAGARNEIARAVAVHDDQRAREAIATGWLYVAYVSAIIFSWAGAALALTPLAGWLRDHVFNGVDVEVTLWLVVGGACASFALNYVQSVLAALERASAFSLYSLIVNVGFLLLLAISLHLSLVRMEWIALLYVLAMMGGNCWLIFTFLRQFPQFAPSLSAVNHARRHSILNFGIKLFLIQIAALVIFTTSRLLASAWLGPKSVVIYDAGFKMFALVTMVHTLIMSTMWSSFTQAFERREFAWIRGMLRNLLALTLPLGAACALVAACSPWIVRHWLGDAQVGPINFYSVMAAVTVLSCWSNIYAYVLNGVGDTRVQLLSAIASGVINIPATYFFTVYLDLGIVGIPAGTATSLIPFSILGPLAVRRLLREREAEPAPIRPN